MGIFAIRNQSNGKLYVARAQDLDRIWNGEQFKLDSGGHPNRELQADWKDFGPANFTFEVLHELNYSDDPAADPKADLAALEQLVLDELQPYDEKGYNHRARSR